MDKYEMQHRMMNLTIAVINLAKGVPISQESKVITYQIIKSASSTAANYRAACRAKSTKDFISKMGIVKKNVMKLHSGWNWPKLPILQILKRYLLYKRKHLKLLQ